MSDEVRNATLDAAMPNEALFFYSLGIPGSNRRYHGWCLTCTQNTTLPTGG